MTTFINFKDEKSENRFNIYPIDEKNSKFIFVDCNGN